MVRVPSMNTDGSTKSSNAYFTNALEQLIIVIIIVMVNVIDQTIRHGVILIGSRCSYQRIILFITFTNINKIVILA